MSAENGQLVQMCPCGHEAEDHDFLGCSWPKCRCSWTEAALRSARPPSPAEIGDDR